jgi:TP901 family phage tail tape measure protein
MPGGKIDILVEPDLRGFGSKLGKGLNSLGGIASSAGKGLGLAVAAGTAVAAVGLKSVINLGIEYTGKLNEMQAVSNATALQMAQVGNTAKALGSDLTLPATSAAGAAAAMLELAKGGLSVDQSMKAAKGTLQLAAAAQIDAAAAAEIQSNALNQFGLSAENAGRVADVLANTANAASGSIGDIALALKYVGPVAKSVGVSIEDTATAIGLLANKGIQADTAGTSLRGMLASLAAPSKPAAKALNALGVEAFDSAGKFVGFRSVIDQLSVAQKKMTQEQFAAAAATAFGREPLAAIVALAESGAPAFDEMAVAVGRQGGAADVAAAKMKGLGGAWEGFKSQLETAGIEIFESIDGPLESIVRKGSDFVQKFTPAVKRGLDSAVAAGQLFGPDLAKAIGSKASALSEVAGKLVSPLVQGLKDTLNSGIEIGVQVFRDFAEVVHDTVDAVEPLAIGIGNVVESFNRADGPIGAFGAALGIAYDIIKGVVGIVSPVIGLVADLVEGFANLPGPIQTAALALLALKVGPSILSGLRGALSGSGKDADEAAQKTGLFSRAMGLVAAPVKLVASGLTATANTFRQFNAEATAQQAIAQRSSAFLSLQADGFRSAQGDADKYGQSIGRLSAYNAAFNTSTIPAVAALRNFRDQTVAIREGAAAAGEPIGRMGAAISTLTERSPALSAMRDSFRSAADGASRFGTVAGIASAAGTGLKSAAGGLMGALGGPFGLAIAGASIGLGFLANAQERAAQKAKEHSAGVDGLATVLRESKGALDASVRATAAKTLQDTQVLSTGKNILQLSRELGVEQGLLTEGYLGSAGAQSLVNSQLDRMIAAGTSVIDTESGKQQVMDLSAQSALNLKEQLGLTNKQYAEAVQKNRDLENAIKNGSASMLDATESGRTFAAAMKTLGDRTATADDKARALKEALDAFSGGQVGLDESLANMNEQFDRLGVTFGANIDKTKGFGNELLTSAGRINTASENGRTLRDSLEGITSSTLNVAQRTFDMTGSLTDAQKVVQDSRDRFIAMAGKMGLSATQAGILADQMGLIPEQVATVIQTPGMTTAQKELVIFQGMLQRTPPGKDVIINSITDEAKRKLEEIGFKVTRLPDGRFAVHAETGNAQADLDRFIRENANRQITIRAAVTTSSSVGVARQPGGGRVVKHDGGIVRAFADGGFERKLTPMRTGIAEVVRPNTWRVLGDRLRDDEAYIPINRSSRSQAILRQTADQMGFALLRRFASGGVAVASGSTQQSLPGTPLQVGGDTFIIGQRADPFGTAQEVQRLRDFRGRLH